MTKKLFYAANWKMNKGPKETREFLTAFLQKLPDFKRNQTIIFPSSICLEAASQLLRDTGVVWGAQNCYSQPSGAFTGETSAGVVKDLGGQAILLGHSERRTLFAETDAAIADKSQFVQSLDMLPMVCIGETLSERQAGRTEAILQQQLSTSLAKTDFGKNLMIAYEPVWAIGTGQVATTAQVDQAHNFIRQVLKKLSPSRGSEIPILYGGSVKGSNAKELSQIAEVGGFLVGGASLEVDSFLEIYSAC